MGQLELERNKDKKIRKSWLEKNPTYYQNYRDNHREEIKHYNKKYRTSNPGKYQNYSSEYYIRRKKLKELERLTLIEKEKLENKKYYEKLEFNKRLINLSSNISGDGLIDIEPINNNLHVIYDSTTHKFIIPTVKI